MPIYVSHVKKPRRIHVTAPIDEYQLICVPPTFEFDVLLNDYINLTDDEFLWTQEAGITVPITTISEDTMEFPTTDRTDKIFRLNINIGTNRHEYVDVYIFFTPTSRQRDTGIISDKYYVQQTIPSLTQLVTYDVADPTPFYLDTDFADVATQLLIEPTTIPLIAGNITKMELLGTGGFLAEPTELFGEIQDLGSLEYDEFFVPNGSYKVRATYSIPSGLVTYLSPAIVVNKSIDDGNVRVIQVLPPNGATTGKLTSLTRTGFVRRSFLSEYTSEGGILSRLPYLKRNTARQLHYANNTPELDVVYTAGNLLNSRVTSLTRVNNVVIGS